MSSEQDEAKFNFEKTAPSRVGGVISGGYGKVDEFALLMRICRHERVNFLREIQNKQLFSITQKDMITGDSVLHLSVFQNKTEFIRMLIS